MLAEIEKQEAVLIYELSWEEIKETAWPPAGYIYVCKDPQRRCSPECWVVSIMGDGTFEGDTTQAGLFWEKEDAILFATALLNKKNGSQDSKKVNLTSECS